MNFGQALQAVMEQGIRATRLEWFSPSVPNPAVPFIFLVPGSTFKVNRPPLLGIYPEGTVIDYHGHVDIKSHDGTITPWQPSQYDMLATDWELLEPGQLSKEPHHGPDTS